MIDTVDGIMITLHVASEQVLFIMLGSGGSITRCGTGSINDRERDMVIGITREPLFEKLRAEINPEWFDHQGIYDIPDKKGLPCELTIHMKHTDYKESGLQFRYGTESLGPPPDVRHFVRSAVSLSDPWFQQQKKTVAGSEGEHETTNE